MSRRGQLTLAGVLALAGILGVVLLLTTRSGSPRSYINDNYALVSREGDSAVYSSPKPASAVVKDISGRWAPADRVVDPSGYFLRYADDMVAVSPEGTGSRIHVDDEQRGYARWFPYVGGIWGTSSGRAEGFRGGGPGVGK
jgi:hypothetical protein